MSPSTFPLLPRLCVVFLALFMVLGLVTRPLAERPEPESSSIFGAQKTDTPGKFDKHGAFASPDIVSPEHILSLLPPDISPAQRKSASLAIQEAAPRLQENSRVFVKAYGELRELSFSRNTPPDCLSNLGNELSVSRKALRRELRTLSRTLERITGRNPRLDDPKSHPMVKHVRKE